MRHISGLQILGGAGIPALLMPLIFMLIELLVIVKMFRLANARHAAT